MQILNVADDKLRGLLKKLVKLREEGLFHIFRSQFFMFWSCGKSHVWDSRGEIPWRNRISTKSENNWIPRGGARGSRWMISLTVYEMLFFWNKTNISATTETFFRGVNHWSEISHTFKINHIALIEIFKEFLCFTRNLVQLLRQVIYSSHLFEGRGWCLF